MAIASGSRRQIAYVPEVVFGTTPATPTFKVFRATGGTVRTNKTTVVSDEIRSDRNVIDELMTGQDVTGQYPFEFSAGTLDDILEAALCGAWTTNVLKNGTAQKSFTFEERLDLGGGNFSFSRFDGCQVNTLALNLTSRSLVTGSIDIMGQNESLDTAILTGATYTSANTKAIQTTSTGVAALAVAGVTPAPKIRQLSLQVSNNMRTRPVVGSLFTDSFGYGRCDVTGSMQAYFESNALYQQVLAHGSGAISFTLGTVTNEKYTFLIPVARFLDGERMPGGNSDDVMVTIPFRGIYDATSAASIVITRNVA